MQRWRKNANRKRRVMLALAIATVKKRREVAAKKEIGLSEMFLTDSWSSLYPAPNMYKHPTLSSRTAIPVSSSTKALLVSFILP